MLSRRSVLKLSAAGAGAAAGSLIAGPAFSEALGLGNGSFQYGVAAGDPLPGGFIIWTRVTPDPSATPGTGLGAPTQVRWIVANDLGLTSVVSQGLVTTDAVSDHTVKIDVTGLSAATVYYYGFRIEATGEQSRIGSAKTAPAVSASPSNLRFGFVSCSNYEAGYFTPYRYLATRCLDFMLHVGDYTYEYGNGKFGQGNLHGRLHDPATDTVSLSDYRRRQAIYKADPDLQDLHAACAWITTIDDHETADNSWRDGAVNHDPLTQGAYVDRRNFAYQAYAEWMPIRLASPVSASGAGFYRSFQFGDLAQLLMLDLRQFRDQQPTTFATTAGSGGAGDPLRTMLGVTEKTWLDGQLNTAGPRWRLIGNSVQFMQVDYPALPGFLATGPNSSRNVDAWDGYIVARAQLEQTLGLHAADFDAVFLTGDIHSSWAAELPLFLGAQVTAPYQSLGIEFVCPSVTSDGFKEVAAQLGLSAQLPLLLAGTQAANPHVKMLDGSGHGCCIVQVTPTQTQCDWYFTTSSVADERWDPNPTFTLAYSRKTDLHSKQVTVAAGPIVDDCPPPITPVSVPESGRALMLPIAAAVAVAAVGAAVRLRQREVPDASTV